MKKLTNGLTLAVAALALVLVQATPAQGADTAKGVCTAVVGSNTVKYDCNYVAKDYAMGTPLSLQLDYECSVRCGGVLAFGLSGPGYAPKGEVQGQIVSVDRSPGSMTFTLQFDKLHEDASDRGTSNGTAFLTMMLNVDDGTGRLRPTSLPFKVHVNSSSTSAATLRTN